MRNWTRARSSICLNSAAIRDESKPDADDGFGGMRGSPGDPVRVTLSMPRAWAPLSLVLLSACGGTGPLGEGVTVTDSMGIPVVFSARPTWDQGATWSLSEDPRLSIGTVEGDQPYLFFSVSNAFLLPDGGVVVVHSTRPPGFRVYDRTGAHVRSFGGEGEGPGEFRRLWRGWLDDDGTLIGYDPGLGRISRFTLDGEFVESLSVQKIPGFRTMGAGDGPPSWIGRFDDGGLLGRTTGPSPSENGRSRPPFVVAYLDLPTLKYDTVAVVPGPEWNVEGVERGFFADFAGVEFGPTSVAVAHDTTAFVSDNKDFWIEEVSKGGVVLRRFGRAYEPEPVTQENLEEYWANLRARSQSDFQREELKWRERHLVFADSYPVHDIRMNVDSDGHLWVALRSPGDSDIVEWSVFDPNGVWLGDVSTPKQLRIKEIGTDAVVGVWRDDLDVQSVRVYDLKKPRG